MCCGVFPFSSSSIPGRISTHPSCRHSFTVLQDLKIWFGNRLPVKLFKAEIIIASNRQKMHLTHVCPKSK